MTTVGRRVATGWLFVVALVAITLIGPLSVHFYLPVAPVIKERFGVNAATAQLAFSLTLFAMAVSTLVYGSLSDRFGRRPALVGGIALSTVGGAICIVATDMTVLLCGRLLQAFGAGCSMVMTRAIARDVYAPDKLVKALAYLTMAYILGPMLAPPIGGALVDTFGWRSIFVVAALAGAVIFLLVLKVLAETRSAPSGVPIRLFAAYAQLSRNLRFLAFVMQSGFGSGAFFAQASAVTYLMQELLRRPASEFGVYFMFFPCSFWIGTFVASRMSGKVGIETMVVVGTGVMVAAAAALAGLMLSGLVLPVTLFAPGFFLTMGQGLSLPSSQTGALTSVGRELTGTASGVGAFLQLFVGAVFCQVVGFAADGTPNPMVVVVAVCTVVAFLSAHVPATIAPAVRPPSKPS